MQWVEERFRLLDDYIGYKPTPVVDMRDLSFGRNTLHGWTYDLQGRRLQGKPERGVYIQNGRKYLR